MLSFRRALDAVTLRRIIAVLLLGGFAEAAISPFCWLVSIGWGLKDVAALRALLLSGFALGVQAGLIYLCIRAPRWLLDRRPRSEPAIFAEPSLDEQGHPARLEEIDAAAIGTDLRSRDGRGGGSGLEHD